MTDVAALKQLAHPGIVKVFDVVEDPGNFYIITELMQEDLAQRLLKRGVITEAEVASVIMQVLKAL